VLVYSKSLNLQEIDYNLILDTYNSIKWKEDYIIYLTAKPETILKRIIQRGSLDVIRQEWNEDDRNYLMKILSFYKQFLSSRTNVFTINTENLTPDEVVNKIKNIIVDLSDYSFEKVQQPSTTQMNLSEFF
jgi:deoxyadenosine/deoxycytidine kinase